MAYLLYTEGDSATVVTRGFVLTDDDAERQKVFGIGANEKLLPIASSVTPEARPITGITLNSDASEITALSYTDPAARTTASIKAEARVHLRSRMDEMKWIWGPTGQRWRNCRLWLLSMAVVIKGICDVIDDSTHAQHDNWDIDDAIGALEAAKALAPEVIPGDRLAVLATALSLTQPLDTNGVRFWYFGHGETAWAGYWPAVGHSLTDSQPVRFQWRRGDNTPSFADDASGAFVWNGTNNTLSGLTLPALTGEVESILT